MLRRTHGHHRDLRAWLNPTVSTDSPNRHDQDRYFMSRAQTASQQIRSSCRWSSTGHQPLAPMQVLELRSSPNRHSDLTVDRQTTTQPYHHRRSPGLAPPSPRRTGRGGQIPIVHAAPPLIHSRVSFLGGFRTPAPLARHFREGRHPKPFTMNETARAVERCAQGSGWD